LIERGSQNGPGSVERLHLGRRTVAASDLELYGDTLGPKGSSGATYLTMERANADAMIRGFTAGAQSCTIPGI
jgi:hypothetical protein